MYILLGNINIFNILNKNIYQPFINENLQHL